jgi:hypothetical protein
MGAEKAAKRKRQDEGAARTLVSYPRKLFELLKTLSEGGVQAGGGGSGAGAEASWGAVHVSRPALYASLPVLYRGYLHKSRAAAPAQPVQRVNDAPLDAKESIRRQQRLIAQRVTEYAFFQTLQKTLWTDERYDKGCAGPGLLLIEQLRTDTALYRIIDSEQVYFANQDPGRHIFKHLNSHVQMLLNKLAAIFGSPALCSEQEQQPVSEEISAIFVQILTLNHSLLEPHLGQLLCFVWNCHHAASQAGYPRAGAFVRAANSLSSTLVLTYVKLRQFETIYDVLFSAAELACGGAGAGLDVAIVPLHRLVADLPRHLGNLPHLQQPSLLTQHLTRFEAIRDDEALKKKIKSKLMESVAESLGFLLQHVTVIEANARKLEAFIPRAMAVMIQPALQKMEKAGKEKNLSVHSSLMLFHALNRVTALLQPILAVLPGAAARENDSEEEAKPMEADAPPQVGLLEQLGIKLAPVEFFEQVLQTPCSPVQLWSRKRAVVDVAVQRVGQLHAARKGLLLVAEQQGLGERLAAEARQLCSLVWQDLCLCEEHRDALGSDALQFMWRTETEADLAVSLWAAITGSLEHLAAYTSPDSLGAFARILLATSGASSAASSAPVAKLSQALLAYAPLYEIRELRTCVFQAVVDLALKVFNAHTIHTRTLHTHYSHIHTHTHTHHNTFPRKVLNKRPIFSSASKSKAQSAKTPSDLAQTLRTSLGQDSPDLAALRAVLKALPAPGQEAETSHESDKVGGERRLLMEALELMACFPERYLLYSQQVHFVCIVSLLAGTFRVFSLVARRILRRISIEAPQAIAQLLDDGPNHWLLGYQQLPAQEQTHTLEIVEAVTSSIAEQAEGEPMLSKLVDAVSAGAAKSPHSSQALWRLKCAGSVLGGLATFYTHNIRDQREEKISRAKICLPEVGAKLMKFVDQEAAEVVATLPLGSASPAASEALNVALMCGGHLMHLQNFAALHPTFAPAFRKESQVQVLSHASSLLKAASAAIVASAREEAGLSLAHSAAHFVKQCACAQRNWDIAAAGMCVVTGGKVMV